MPTSNPVPSDSPLDLLFNAQKIDEAVSSPALTYTDRLGVPRRTLAGAVASIAQTNPRGPWVTATAYAVLDVVQESGTWWICVDAHTSSASFATDEASRWRVYQGVTEDRLASTASASDGDAMIGYGAVTSISSGVLTRHASISAAITTLGSIRATILVREDTSVTTATLPANLTLRVENGAQIAVTGVLTVNGKFWCGRVQCFTGAGSVSMANAKVANVYAEWFGALPDDTTECSAPIMLALESAASIPVTLGAGNFRTTAKIVIYGNASDGYQKLFGAGRRTTFIRCAGADSGIQSDQAAVADYIELGNFTVEKVGTTQTQVGLDLGTMRNGKATDITALNFLVGCGLTKNVDALGNYYNQIIRVIAACGSPVAGSRGFQFGNQISGHTNREGNANDLIHCRSYDCETGIWMLGIGNTIKAHKIVSCTDSIMLYETSFDNRIEAYCENATGTMGTAEATCVGNYLDLFNDATSLTPFNDLGWNFITGNNQAGGAGYPAPFRALDCSITDHISVQGEVGVSLPIFRVTLPDTNAAVRVVVTFAGFTFTVNNYSGIQQWDVHKKAAGTPTIGTVVTTGDNRWTVAAAANGEVTWSLTGDAALFTSGQVTVSIQGTGSASGTGLGERIGYVRLV